MNTALAPLVWRVKVSLTPPSDTDKQADVERLTGALDGNPFYCSLHCPVRIPLTLARKLPAVLRESGFDLSVVLGWDGTGCRVLSFNPAGLYGIAMDVGSTNVTAQLVDLDSGEVLSTLISPNPQSIYGADVLTRMFYAISNGGESLHKALIAGVNGIVEDLMADCGANTDDVMAVSIAGNTIMTHFLLNLPVENIPVTPYVPAIHAPGFVSPGDFGLEVNPEAVVYVFPSTGSYVGGDIVAGILATGLYGGDTPSALIDVGTNAEIAIGSKDWILVGAGAAGPAFDEGVADIGKRACPGAVYAVNIDGASYAATLKTFGGLPPEGLCGSAMVSLVAELHRVGLIDDRGCFISGKAGITTAGTEGDEPAYVLYDDAGGRRLILSQKDVDNFMRTKAASFTLFYVLTGTLGLTFGDIERVYVTGALGTGIDPKAAVRLGLIPDFPENRLVFLDNTSLKGAEALLLNRHLLDDVRCITSLITYKQMNEDGDFMREFLSACFIPHSEPGKLKVAGTS
ncbi:MAG: DUF4445 domain-containing protein [Nitrospirae bacterium]|nr:DUF4445 domain-containing protein [Nitrospirota bacterium]